MFAIIIKFFVVLLLCQFEGICAEFISIDLSEQPEYEVLELHEGSSLEIKCIRFVDSRHHLRVEPTLSYPNPSDNGENWSNRVYSSETITKWINDVEADTYSNTRLRKYTYVFRRENMIHGDTGEYSCLDLYSGKPSTKIYIYVESTTSHFVEDISLPMPNFVLNRKSNDIGIPMDYISLPLSCQPSSILYDVRVTKDGEPIKLPNDPKKNIALVENPSAGLYKCEVSTNGNIIATKEYHVTEVYEDFLPMIEGNQVVNVTKNQEFSINCTTVYDNSWKPIVLLNWISNVTNVFGVRQFEFIHPTIANYRILINELRFLHIVDGHMGDYTCELEHLNVSHHSIVKESRSIQLIVLPEETNAEMPESGTIENMEDITTANLDYGIWDDTVFNFISILLLLLVVLIVLALAYKKNRKPTDFSEVNKEEDVEVTSGKEPNLRETEEML